MRCTVGKDVAQEMRTMRVDFCAVWREAKIKICDLSTDTIREDAEAIKPLYC